MGRCHDDGRHDRDEPGDEPAEPRRQVDVGGRRCSSGHYGFRISDGLLRENSGQYGRARGPCQPILCRLRQGLGSPIVVALMPFVIGRLVVKEPLEGHTPFSSITIAPLRVSVHLNP